MSTMEAINPTIEIDKIDIKDDPENSPKEDKYDNFTKEIKSFRENSCKSKSIFLQEKKTRSTPTSPNCFRSPATPEGQNKPRRESPVIRLALFPRLEKCVSEPEVWGEKTASGQGEEPQEVDNTCSASRSEGHISHFSQEKEVQEEEEGEKKDRADDIEHIHSERKMLSESERGGQLPPPVIGLRSDPAPPCPEETLIMPRKLQNPCLDSRDHQNLHRELLFNQKIGKNVLNQKSELQRALEKHKETQIKKEQELQKQDNRTPFEKVIEERARRLESLEKNNIEEEPSNKPEFLQVHAKLRARMDTK